MALNKKDPGLAEQLGVEMTRNTLSVLKACDVVVAGGSFAGVACALHLARAGCHVVLVEPRTYLGREMTAKLRPWVSLNGTTEENLPELIKACIAETRSDFKNNQNEIPLQMDAVKTVLEDLLLGVGVELIYASLPVQFFSEGEKKTLVIANKSGRQALVCKMVVDATEQATVARLSGDVFEQDITAARYSKTIEFNHVGTLAEKDRTVPEAFGFAGNSVTFHQGYREEGHIYAEFSLPFPFQSSMKSAMEREIDSRHRAMKLATYLISEVPAFEEAGLVAASYELDGPAVRSFTESPSKWSKHLSELRIHLENGNDLTLDRFAGPTPFLWSLSEAARLKSDETEQVREPVFAERLGKALANGLLDHWEKIFGYSGAGPEKKETDALLANVEVKELESPKRGGQYVQTPISPEVIPVFRATDVLVVGGGTSGATAATTSAHEGAGTVLLEMNPGLGGTGTFGGVDSYWFGRKGGFNERLNEKVEKLHEALRHKRNKWNIEAKMYVLLQEAEKAGVEMYFNVMTVGTLVNENRVRGVVVATRWGLFAVMAETVIDASGDGDIAAFAGAEFVYGSSRDNVAMWYSLAQFSRPGLLRNNFTSMVDVSNVEDYTRAILAGRRRKRDDGCHDHGIYVATRESRHILADVIITQTDQLLQKQWPDVINIHFSNTDIKGKSQSNWIHLGLIPPNLEIEIPYRVLVPKGLDGILIAGKAISASHDAFAPVRMQADLENLGGVVGIAAALAVRKGITPREIDVAELQKRLIKEGLLPKEVLDREIPESSMYTDEELKELIQSMAGDRSLYAYSDMEMHEVFRDRIPLVEVCTTGPKVIPFLEEALLTAEGEKRVRIAQALAWYQSPYAVPVLSKEIERQFTDEELPGRDSHIRYAGAPPDQGAMPSAAYLVYTLGLVPDRRNLKVWEQIADRLDPQNTDISDGVKGIFYYVDAVCFGIERLADPDAVPILAKIHAMEPFREQISKKGFQTDYFPERQAMLELSLARAFARCGSPKGYKILISYLNDVRALLAEQAHKELREISGTDFGKNTRLWADWLKEQAAELQCCPVTENFV